MLAPAEVDTIGERTAIYRLYDDDGALLYVGVSKNPRGRFAQHASSQPWWPHCRREVLIWADSREDALAAEQVAIREERPRFNIVYAEVNDTTQERAALAGWARNKTGRDALVRVASEAGVTKHQIHVITGIARTTIDSILKNGGEGESDV